MPALNITYKTGKPHKYTLLVTHEYFEHCTFALDWTLELLPLFFI